MRKHFATIQIHAISTRVDNGLAAQKIVLEVKNHFAYGLFDAHAIFAGKPTRERSDGAHRNAPTKALWRTRAHKGKRLTSFAATLKPLHCICDTSGRVHRDLLSN
jgi:hypothetical protein